ncbi:MAG TPA: sigma-70 family RNA polymerase sigma factor [Gemmatimonadales bacterium]|nr:sigma-70 family RNA polymerase sigma factor [Gemmatimonadales bacterium]
MADRQSLEALFLAQLGWIERAAAAVCRRHGLSADESADFTSFAKLKLVENDYAVLARFRAESAITTYLVVVLSMLFRDYRAQHWGRWRPSAAARRQGGLAIRLETLVYRDRVPLGQAAEMLRSSGQTELSDRELAGVLAQLPARNSPRPTPVGSGLTGDPPAPNRSDDFLHAEEADTQERVIREALERLPAEDQVLLRLRFWEGLSVADIARSLGLPQKPLYRRLERAMTHARRLLEQAGMSKEYARAVLNE